MEVDVELLVDGERERLRDALQAAGEHDRRAELAEATRERERLAGGEADAGFVYATDARTVKGKVATISIRRSAQPIVRYAAAVVTASGHKAAARHFVARLLGKAAQRKLRAAGFLHR